MPYRCTKFTCDTPAHTHVDTRNATPTAIGAQLWRNAGDANAEEYVAASGSVARAASYIATFLHSGRHEGGCVLIDDADGKELNMEEYVRVYLEAAVQTHK
jgi:hypothetical protein